MQCSSRRMERIDPLSEVLLLFTFSMISRDSKLGSKGFFGILKYCISFQWFQDLKKTIHLLKSYLKKDGCLAFSIFGPETFHELKHALKLFIKKDILLPSSSFFDGHKLKEIINSEFSKTHLDQQQISKVFPSVYDLFKSIKFTGTQSHPIAEKKFWTPSCIKKLDQCYRLVTLP